MPIVFVHGSGYTGTTWRNQVSEFPSSLALDLPGHPDGTGRTTVDEYVDWLSETLTERGIQRPLLVGHSLGGAIVQSFALRYPDRLHGLGLIGTGARLRVLPAILDGLRSNYGETIRWLADLEFAPNAPRQVKADAVETMAGVAPAVTLGDYEACNRFDVMERVDEISVPTLVLCGAEDQMTPVKYSKFLANRIPNARLEVIPGAGHMVMVEKPAEFNRALADFVASLHSEK